MTRDLPGVWIPSSGEPPAKWESARGSSRAVDSRSGDADSASAVAAAAVCTDRATVSGDGIAVCRVRPLCWGLQSRKEHSGTDAASMAALVRLSAAARTLSAYSASFLPPPAPPVPCVPEAPPASVVGNGIAVGIRDRVACYRAWSPSALVPTVPVTVSGPRSLVTVSLYAGAPAFLERGTRHVIHSINRRKIERLVAMARGVVAIPLLVACILVFASVRADEVADKSAGVLAAEPDGKVVT